MKIAPVHRQGSAVMVVLVLLGILSLYVLVNARTLARLKHDVKLIEQRQIRRSQFARPGPAARSHFETNLVMSEVKVPTLWSTATPRNPESE